MIAALVALAGALVYGSADFLGGLAARRLRSIVVTAVAAASGLVALLALMPFVGGAWLPADVLWGALSGVLGVVAIVLLYACLAVGPMSILSPLTAVITAVAPMSWGLLVQGEAFSPLGYVGLAVALVAVILVGFIPGEKVVRPSTRGLLMAVGAGTTLGAFLIALDQTSATSGLVPLVVNRATNTAITAMAVVALVVLARRRGVSAADALVPAGARVGAAPSGHIDLEHASTGPVPSPVGPRVSPWWLAVGCGVLDVAANAAALFALRAGDLAVVSALTALYPAGTILLAAVVLRERVAVVQWVGLVLALAAGGLLAVG
ncbi:MAG: hypothetical protein CMH34_01935 [Microbacterium sp.]|nr:hypothetical protein [Microbacterium sp.]